MSNTDTFEAMMRFSGYVSNIIFRTGGLLISFKATAQKIDEMADSGSWYDKESSRSDNKHNMKQHGVAVFGYMKFHKELSIIGIAKTIEDIIVDVKELSGFNFDFWKSTLALQHFDDMRYIRQLNNCIKHSKGIVVNDNSSCNRYLIDRCGVPPETEIGFLFDIDIEDYIVKSFIFQMDIVHQIMNRQNSYHGMTPDEVKGLLIPEHMSF